VEIHHLPGQDEISEGGRGCVPPKKGRSDPFWVDDERGPGWEDAAGNVWQWDPSGHGGGHWDVQRSPGHTNVGEDGGIVGGTRNDHFPTGVGFLG